MIVGDYMEEKKMSSKLVYSCSFLDLREDQVLLPNQKISSRIYVDHIGAACVLPITKDKLIILTKQYRYPIREISLEIPAGKKDSKEESGYDCVKRELEEETGYQSDHIEYHSSFYNCVGYSNEEIEFFIAYDSYKVENPRPMDEDEFIEIDAYSLEEVKELISKGVIKDVKTIVAIQTYELMEK
jgi:ADP-ribose pyrophosphatase